ncbi:hypothetical protein [Mycobacterium intracellulare]|uniref:hypothetical protein n=1 Tax=Mycobacterium intracellulare TaxID=1767 RepID=UPI0006CA83A4|nr:hypothetical protein [Mycobacterium intracellulare]AOS92129.1 hypothetical protein AN480_12815 [Mycobacterium intracellulare subsp. chimaera]ASQ86392.1 hypothetical protein CE197_12875 [Mycobacterium intracellulare subsp. chimaera]KPN44841.1 hypothetical protein AN933_29725 [Mycobacterium intracellulare subsp. chimaera]KPN48507.1 hypothetical protein AN931_23445 [Mycobacterium intracellulare subsp. chimaera]MCA2311255.1 hypothetical protein [Mycobacterium intracellulare subsp. chimaera]
MLPLFFAADALCAAGRQVHTPPGGHRRRHTPQAEQFAHYADSIAPSSNLMVRGSALAGAGGFVAYNEITGLLRGVHALGSARVVATWDFQPDADNVLADLYDCAMRISARRALGAICPRVCHRWRNGGCAAGLLARIRAVQALIPAERRATG